MSAARGSDARLLELAGAVAGGVWVRGLGVDAAIFLDVVEGEVHETSLAAVVALLRGAVDEVLLRERDQLASLLEVLALERAGGAERPARPAHALVLDRGDVAFGTPVDLFGKDGKVRRKERRAAALLRLRLIRESEVVLLELGVGQVSETGSHRPGR